MFDAPNRCVAFFFRCKKLPPIPGFDNDFFGIDLEEAQAISPSQRWVMEVGYEVGTGGHVTGGNHPATPGRCYGKLVGPKQVCEGNALDPLWETLGLSGTISISNKIAISFLAENFEKQQLFFLVLKKKQVGVCSQFLGCRTF